MSIYSISNFGSQTYNTWDIVRYPSNTNDFYYCLKDSVDGSQAENTPSISSSVWGGLSSFNGKIIPKFIWRPNYGGATTHEPSTLEVRFADGYAQRIIQNINNDLITLDLTFDLRTEKETQAIMHFLYARAARDSFLFTPTTPHDTEKLFVCKRFTETYVYYNNHVIRATFEETAVQSR